MYASDEFQEVPDTNSPPCQDCGRPLQQAASDSIKQWVSACRCNENRSRERRTEPIETCAFCKKRIANGKPGSVTQWVFGNDSCCCSIDVSHAATTNTDIESASEASRDEQTVEEPEMDLDPDNFPRDRYKPIVEIGRGAAGIVYLCRDRLLHKKVAVKVLRAVTAEQLVNFQLEAKATSQLKHPSVVGIMDFGCTASGAPYMVLEYARGINLEQYIHTHGPLPWEQALSVFVAVADALGAAHKRGIFHRDLKSSNILIISSSNYEQEVRLIDFGVAAIKHLTQEPTIVQGHTIVGTPAYMPPDQAKGFPYDARSEIYALGCVLFEALAGEVPFQGDTALETIAKHAQDKVPELEDIYRGDFPDQLQHVVNKCLAKDPDLRYQSMADFSEALKGLSGATMVEKSVTNKTSDRLRFSFLWIVASLLIVGFLVITGFYTFEFERPAVKRVDNDQLIDYAGDSYELEEIARKQMALGNYKQALENAKKSVQLNKFNQAGIELRGLAYFLNGFPQQARADFMSILAHKRFDYVSEAAEFHLEILNRASGVKRRDFKKMVYYRPAHWELKALAPWLKGDFQPYQDMESTTIGSRGNTMAIEYGVDDDLSRFDSNFRSLRLYGGNFTKFGLHKLKGSKLRRMFLSNVEFDSDSFSMLSPLPQLINLQLSSQTRVGELLRTLAGSPIESIIVTSCSFDGDSFANLRNWKHLKSVDISNCSEFDGSAWHYLSRSAVSNVRWIPMANSNRMYPSQYLQTVCEFPELTSLSLDVDAIDQTNSKAFNTLHKLATLELTGLHPASEDCLAKVRNINTLKTLQMFGETVSKQGLLALVGLHLHQLKLSQLHLDPGIVLALTKLNVDELQLGFASGDTKLIRHLARMKSLRRIIITGDATGQLTDSVIKDLRRGLPNCTIDMPIQGAFKHEGN